MLAFDTVFWDIARRESRTVLAEARAGVGAATFVLREHYCTERGCDCRRVTLHVHWVEAARVAAIFAYAFDQAQVTVEPTSPTNARERELLALVSDALATDAGYRDRLVAHYALWRAVVDDPAHPDHAKVRPAAPGFTPPRAHELAVAQPIEADAGAQQQFRQLVEQVEELRARVRTWHDARPTIDRESSLHAALFERQTALALEMVQLLDRSYVHPSLGDPDRRKLGLSIAALAAELIETGAHDELKPLYNRYTGSDVDSELAAADAKGATAVKAMLARYGIDTGDADVSTLDKLHAFTEAQLAALHARAAAVDPGEPEPEPEPGSGSARRISREQAGKALQAVYRALAKELHPDREQDPVERARKAELMRDVNLAYEANDLLRLLELQLALERVDPSKIHGIAADQLVHYNQILDEQALQLAIELEELELPFRIRMNIAPTARLAPADIVARIQTDAAKLERRIGTLERDLVSLADITRLRGWLLQPKWSPRT